MIGLEDLTSFGGLTDFGNIIALVTFQQGGTCLTQKAVLSKYVGITIPSLVDVLVSAWIVFKFVFVSPATYLGVTGVIFYVVRLAISSNPVSLLVWLGVNVSARCSANTSALYLLFLAHCTCVLLFVRLPTTFKLTWRPNLAKTSSFNYVVWYCRFSWCIHQILVNLKCGQRSPFWL